MLPNLNTHDLKLKRVLDTKRLHILISHSHTATTHKGSTRYGIKLQISSGAQACIQNPANPCGKFSLTLDTSPLSL